MDELEAAIALSWLGQDTKADGDQRPSTAAKQLSSTQSQQVLSYLQALQRSLATTPKDSEKQTTSVAHKRDASPSVASGFTNNVSIQNHTSFISIGSDFSLYSLPCDVASQLPVPLPKKIALPPSLQKEKPAARTLEQSDGAKSHFTRSSGAGLSQIKPIEQKDTTCDNREKQVQSGNRADDDLATTKAVEVVQESSTRSAVAEKDGVSRSKRRRRGNRVCDQAECQKYAQGGTLFCVRHGGGKRCRVNGCDSGARGSSLLCILHGGGKRCRATSCEKSAVGATNFCVRHGGVTLESPSCCCIFLASQSSNYCCRGSVASSLDVTSRHKVSQDIVLGTAGYCSPCLCFVLSQSHSLLVGSSLSVSWLQVWGTRKHALL